MGLYSPPHTGYVIAFCVCLAVAVAVFKLALKTEKARTIFIKCLGGLLTACLIANRIALTVWNKNGIGLRELIPNSYCGMTSLLLGLTVLFGKPNMKIYGFLVYLELTGGLACVFYPNFLSQNPSFFFPPTITGMNHHAVGAILCIIMIVGGWFEPSSKNWAVFPLGICAYTVFGLFLIDVLKIYHTMLIDESIIGGTPLKWWFILTAGSAAVFAVNFGYDKIKANIKQRHQNAQNYKRS